MQFLNEWATSDRRRLVVLSCEVIATLAAYRQRFFWQAEAGGILLGRRRGSHIEVVQATEPTLSDRRSTFMFHREVLGHAQAAVQAWALAGGTMDYVGEWHTHPQRVPVPSSIDRAEWHKLAVARPKVSVVAVVVGTHKLHVELVSVKSQTSLLALP
ncbi:MAG: Mov34/MPN/PAD-1 family protein [Polaromonas sp.]|uniref:Mov34/MPN/PAD-1 family protein n=1 Tax=Polaromonas sp. TaxID=1869339 RepID=UPI0024890762|nr:Mov34/MPN/PAD-1 family protein [Polaromonas sp.]MDI1270550.1 Mov34/MPN/PAD-1 family protein [Polaromonas sp.]